MEIIESKTDQIKVIGVPLKDVENVEFFFQCFDGYLPYIEILICVIWHS